MHLWLHSLNIAYQVVQKWGTIDVNVVYSNYLHDWSKNNLEFGGYLSLRIAKGLSVRISGIYTSIGFSYTFGSIYNNVVNPRFGDSW